MLSFQGCIRSCTEIQTRFLLQNDIGDIGRGSILVMLFIAESRLIVLCGIMYELFSFGFRLRFASQSRYKRNTSKVKVLGHTYDKVFCFVSRAWKTRSLS